MTGYDGEEIGEIEGRGLVGASLCVVSRRSGAKAQAKVW